MSPFEKYIESQVHYIDIEKWFEGIRIGKDPGQEYILDWVKEHAIEFRDKWDNSKCHLCSNKCGYMIKNDCLNFVEEVQRNNA